MPKHYHWTEIRKEVSPKIIGSMLNEGGVKWPINCRLNGEATKGPNATAAEERVVIFDADFVVYRLASLLQQLENDEIAKVMELLSKHFGINQKTETSETKPETKKNGKN